MPCIFINDYCYVYLFYWFWLICAMCVCVLLYISIKPHKNQGKKGEHSTRSIFIFIFIRYRHPIGIFYMEPLHFELINTWFVIDICYINRCVLRNETKYLWCVCFGVKIDWNWMVGKFEHTIGFSPQLKNISLSVRPFHFTMWPRFPAKSLSSPKHLMKSTCLCVCTCFQSSIHKGVCFFACFFLKMELLVAEFLFMYVL